MTGIPALRAVRIATILCLCAAFAQAEEMQRSSIPVFSGSDGSSARIEISRSGDRTTAVPVLEIPGETTRKTTEGNDAECGSTAASAGGEARAATIRTDFGAIVEQHKSLVIREGPEGVSLGNVLDLAGDIQEALKRMRESGDGGGGSPVPEASPREEEPSSGSADAADTASLPPTVRTSSRTPPRTSSGTGSPRSAPPPRE